MDKDLIKKFKIKLEKEKAQTEKELKSFAKKNPKVKGDWNAVFPKFGEEETSPKEETTDEVEEYATLIPIEYSIETKLKKINVALEKIENGTYGICEKCKKQISKQRLEAYPEASTCNKCK